MQFEDDELREFVRIWKTEFGEWISLDRARFHASQLMDLYAVLYLNAAGMEALNASSEDDNQPQ